METGRGYSTENPLQSPETRALYLKRASLIISSIALHAQGGEITLTDITEWLANKATVLAPNTIRQYRAALTSYIREQLRLGLVDPVRAENAILLMQKIRSSGNSKVNTSSVKAKSITPHQISLLLSRLGRKKSRYATAAALMFKGSLIAGLRPVEWFTASLKVDHKTGEGTLTVYNAKATNGRSFGETRELIIPAESVETIEKTIGYLASLRASGISPDSIYAQARKMMLLTGVKNGQRHVCLYTARHQFTANMKNIYRPEEVAMMLGHNSTETASRHYGKRRSGHPEFKELARLKKPQHRAVLAIRGTHGGPGA